MVTIYDMTSGEPIDGEERSGASAPAMREPGQLAPRLLSVEEAVATEGRTNPLPADLAQADIARFLDRQ